MSRALSIAIGGMIMLVLIFAEPAANLTDQARQVTSAFMSRLMSTLTAALSDGGPTHAISVCNVDAPGIAAGIGRETGFIVGRTSLRVRNPNNRPTEWEARILKMFEEKKTGGTPISELEYSEVVTLNGHREFRYMKAIPSKRMCLPCHGTALDLGIRQTIHRLYPDDQATGFAVGDIRGAFIVRKVLDPRRP